MPWNSFPNGSDISAFIVSFVITLLRAGLDNKEPRWWRVVLEAALCGSISVCVSSGVEAFGGQPSLSVFLGGMVGLFGADQVRSWGRRITEAKIRKISESHKDDSNDIAR